MSERESTLEKVTAALARSGYSSDFTDAWFVKISESTGAEVHCAEFKDSDGQPDHRYIYIKNGKGDI